MPRRDIADYYLDNYGTCDREADCFWGKDAQGNFNGCLRNEWRGRACMHWHPLGVTSLQELHAALNETRERRIDHD